MHTYLPSRHRLSILMAALVIPVALSACGKNQLVKEAEKHADASCACTTFDCTLEHTKWFNKNTVMQGDKIKAMSEADQASYTAARKKNATCQNKLRP